MKNKVIAFTIADEKNLPYAKMMAKSLRKWHTEEELPLKIYGPEEIKQYQSKYKDYFYKSAPLHFRELLKEYDLVIKLDADQLITGKLDHIIDIWKDYDVGTVLNINRVDPSVYGLVSLATIAPNEYYNNGLVALRNPWFAEEWWRLCNSIHFDRMPMREQGFLNILCHYGNYNVRCFDRYDPVHNISTWNGLVAKGEGLRMRVVNNQLVLPIGLDNYPDREVVVKAYHWAGGAGEVKMNYRTHFNEEVISWMDWLVS